MSIIELRGVVEKSSGDLIRYGYTDFANDGQFDAATEEIVMSANLPVDPVRRGQKMTTEYHRRTATPGVWELVPQP